MTDIISGLIAQYQVEQTHYRSYHAPVFE